MTTITRSSPSSSVLGFDFGLKKIGVAVGQTITRTASPVGIIAVKNGALSVTELNKLLKTWKPDALVVGIPLNMDGTESLLSQKAEHFAQFLEQTSMLTVYRVDERLSTRGARYELQKMDEYTGIKRRDYRVDAFAACLIVEAWLSEYAG